MAGYGDMYYDPALRELIKLEKLCEQTDNIGDIKSGIQGIIKLFKDRELYCNSVTSEEGEDLQKIDKESRTHDYEAAVKSGKTKYLFDPSYVSGFLEGQFLQSMTSMSRAKKVLEIGMFMGYGALACAEALPADGKVVTCESEAYLVEITEKLLANSPHKDKIDIRVGPAKDTLLQLANEGQTFDLVFIDADKAGYLGYFKTLMEKNLLAEGGTIMFDNALYSGLPYLPDLPDDIAHKRAGGEAIKELNQYLAARKDMHKVMVPLRDGVYIVRRMDETRLANK